ILNIRRGIVRVKEAGSLTSICDLNRRQWRRARRQWCRNIGSCDAGQIEIWGGAGSRVRSGIDSARLVRERVFNDGETASALVGDLITTTHRRFTFTEPWNLICEPNGRTKILPVIVIGMSSRIRRIRSNELEGRLVGSSTRIHPACEIPAGNSERRESAAY